MLVLDKRVSWSRSAFENIQEWNDCKNELKHYCIKCYVQTKAHERDKQHKADENEQSSEHAETDEDDNSDAEIDADGRFSFKRTTPDEVPMRKRNVPEFKKKNADAIAAETECERVIVNWIECKVK